MKCCNLAQEPRAARCSKNWQRLVKAAKCHSGGIFDLFFLREGEEVINDQSCISQKLWHKDCSCSRAIGKWERWRSWPRKFRCQMGTFGWLLFTPSALWPVSSIFSVLPDAAAPYSPEQLFSLVFFFSQSVLITGQYETRWSDETHSFIFPAYHPSLTHSLLLSFHLILFPGFSNPSVNIYWGVFTIVVMAVAVGAQSAPLDGDASVWDGLVCWDLKGKCKEVRYNN